MLSEAMENVEHTISHERFEILKVEGHHEGTKTVITNFFLVAGCLRRDPSHLAKYLFKELAAPGEIAGDRLILTRRVSSQNVNEKIEKYTNNFVLCIACGKPDTELLTEGVKTYLRCLACGAKKEVHNI